MSAFEEVGICPEIIRAVEDDEWLLPSAVQQDAIPLILTGGDVLVAAETGSGKTGAFGLPCLQVVHEDLRGKCQMRESDASNKRCELNMNDKDGQVQVTEQGLMCKCEDPRRWYGVRATTEVIGGKYMFEVEVIGGLMRVGWSGTFAGLELGMESKSYGYGSTGKKSSDRQFVDYGQAYEAGDVIGCLLNRENQTISFHKNGKDLGVAYELPGDFDDVGFKPHICGKGFEAAVKFDGHFEYSVDGYEAIGKIDPRDTRAGGQAPGRRPPMCMILEPTRDLAEQTFKCMTKFSKYLDEPKVRVALFVGGTDEQDQVDALEKGVEICVGTLHKVMDHVKKGRLDVSQIKFFVLDEADDLQKKDDSGTISQLNKQIKEGRRDRVQTLLFSATLHTKQIKELIGEITTNPVWVDLKGKDSVPDTVHHMVYYIDPKREWTWTNEEIAVHAKDLDAQPILDQVHAKPSMSETDKDHTEVLKWSERIKQRKPRMVVKIADLLKMTQCLVFCRTNIDCNNLETYLNRLGGSRGHRGKVESGKENPYSCVVLAAGRSQKERQGNLEAFKDGDVRFLICTDVAARGIDISGLPFVIQMTLPDEAENYIHRIGRCGRADRMGLAISLVATQREKVWFHKCPSRGRNCVPAPGNTKLTVPNGPDNKPVPVDAAKWFVEEGGCCVWQDETEIIKQVEARTGRSVPTMHPEDFSVPGVLESPLGGKKEVDVNAEPLSRRAQKRKADGQQTVVYGSKKNDGAVETNSKHVQNIDAAVRQLFGLELQVQRLFNKAMSGTADVNEAIARAKPGSEVDVAAEPTLLAPTRPKDVVKPATAAWGADKPKKKVRF